MPDMSALQGRTMFISGASRGIGLEIAKRVAADGANVALMAKTDEPHPKLAGTVRYDLMQDINSRGTFVVTQACLPHLRASDHAHVLTLSPPLTADPRWLGGHAAYTLSKLGMTMLTLGVAADEAPHRVGANCLWPRTMIATAAVANLLGGDEMMARCRDPRIMGDAAHAILSLDPADCTGNAFLDDELLAQTGVSDFSGYAAGDGAELQLDIFVEDWGAFAPS
jgi:citronellol/citronellal dehydrogenase